MRAVKTRRTIIVAARADRVDKIALDILPCVSTGARRAQRFRVGVRRAEAQPLLEAPLYRGLQRMIVRRAAEGFVLYCVVALIRPQIVSAKRLTAVELQTGGRVRRSDGES